MTFACKLTNKAYQLDNRVHLRVPDADALAALDTLLWTFSDDSFVPHDVLGSDATQAAVTLAVADQPIPANADVCINLASAAVNEDCARIAEIVSDDQDVKAAGRARYAEYRDRGCTLNTHKIGAR